MAEIPIYEKMPLIGDDALAHRSGIHQDGAAKTKGMKKGAYRPIQPELIGREGEFIGFTSQSGKTAIYEIINNAGYPISMEEAQYLQPIMKKIAEERGELTESEMLDVYFKELIYIKGPYRLVKFEDIDVANEIEKYYIVIEYNGKIIEGIGEGKGPIEAIVYMIRRTLEQNIKLLHYKQIALNDNELGSKAKAMTIIQLTDLDKDLKIICRSLHDDTRKANLYAIINGLNLLEKLKDQKK